MAFGVTSAGFLKPTEAEIEQLLADDFHSVLGSQYSLAPQTFYGQQLQLRKKREIQFWDALESAYFALFISTATGANLDKVAFPFLREDAKKSSVTLTFTGDDTTLIPAGSLAQTAEGTQFETTEDGTIDGSTVDIPAVALIAGSVGNFPVDAINILPVSISGVDSVTNGTAATGGADIESDGDFVARIKVEAQTSRSSSVAAIRKALLEVEGVTQCNVGENKTNEDDPITGIPAKSIQVVVSGSASDQDVATAIYNAKAAGIGTYGAESFTVPDGTEFYEINFDRSTEVNIYVDVFLTTDATWLDAYADTVKLDVLKYIGGVDASDNSYPGLLSGVDVYVWKVIASQGVLDEFGITNITVELSRTSDPSVTETNNIAILASEKAITDLTFIRVYSNNVLVS